MQTIVSYKILIYVIPKITLPIFVKTGAKIITKRVVETKLPSVFLLKQEQRLLHRELSKPNYHH